MASPLHQLTAFICPLIADPTVAEVNAPSPSLIWLPSTRIEQSATCFGGCDVRAAAVSALAAWLETGPVLNQRVRLLGPTDTPCGLHAAICRAFLMRWSVAGCTGTWTD
jgi:hypothetical protein